jgi:hypothetical protein
MSSQTPVFARQTEHWKSLENLNKGQALVPSPCSRIVTSYHRISDREGTLMSPGAPLQGEQAHRRVNQPMAHG